MSYSLLLEMGLARPKRGSETEKLLGARGVGLGDLGGARHATGHLRGLLLEVVAQARLLAADLARTGHPEALAGTGVRLVLRHLLLSIGLVMLCSGKTQRSMSGSSASLRRRSFL